MAKIVIILGLISSLNTFLTSGWPQLAETSRIAFFDDPDIPNYSIRVMRNGTEAEITGGFKYGLTDDFSKILKASRQIKVVHLDSIGGRVGEAIRLNGVLRAQGVDTYVASGCYSACTIAFAAGRNRFIRKGAVLGFHAPAFPGMTKDELESSAMEQKRIFVDAGFDKRFVDRAFSTPSSDMWKPPAELMAAADVITGLSDGNDFAVSGFGGDVSVERMADMLAKGLPLLQVLKEKFPKHYDGGAVRKVVGICAADLRSIEGSRSSGEVNWLGDGFGGKRSPTIDLSQVDLSRRKQGPEQHRGGVG